MKCRVIAGLVVATLAPNAMCSFELMYIPSPNTDRVYRYDPIARVMLGGIDIPSPTAVFHRSGTHGLVRGGSFNYRVDLANGINENSVNTTNFNSITDDGANVFNMSGATAFSMGALGGSVGSTALATTRSMFSGYRLSNGNMVGFADDVTGVRALLFSSAGALLDDNLVMVTTRSASSGMVVTTTNTGARIARVVVRDSTGAQNILSISLNSLLNSFVTTSVTAVNSFTMASTSVMSLAVAHNGFYAVGADGSSPTTTTRILHFNNSNFGGQTLGWTVAIDSRTTSNNFTVANVVAPEPASMAALGLGVIALLRRRKMTQ